MRTAIGLFLVVCWARVACPFGPPAECAVYADPYRGQRCDWLVLPLEVRCRGWDVFGNWVVYSARCPIAVIDQLDQEVL